MNLDAWRPVEPREPPVCVPQCLLSVWQCLLVANCDRAVKWSRLARLKRPVTTVRTRRSSPATAPWLCGLYCPVLWAPHSRGTQRRPKRDFVIFRILFHFSNPEFRFKKFLGGAQMHFQKQRHRSYRKNPSQLGIARLGNSPS